MEWFLLIPIVIFILLLDTRKESTNARSRLED